MSSRVLRPKPHLVSDLDSTLVSLIFAHCQVPMLDIIVCVWLPAKMHGARAPGTPAMMRAVVVLVVVGANECSALSGTWGAPVAR
jgi:hypothetical protein